jgi:hypothetical protein
MPRYNSLHGGKSNAGTREFVLAVEPLKYAEQLLSVLHIESGPIVSDEEDGLALLFSAVPDLDPGVFAP